MTTSDTSTTTSTWTPRNCRLCNKPITFDDNHIGKSGKKIPLDRDTNTPHDCPVWNRSQPYQQQQEQHQSVQQPQQQQLQQVVQPTSQPSQQSQQQPKSKRYVKCSKNCGGEIYFDVNHRTESGRWIPISKGTGLPHVCL